MQNYHLPLVKDQIYHIYNRGNNREDIFYKEKNYHYFLEKYDEYLSSYLNTYAFSLIPNHFHFLIKVKRTDAIAPSDGISRMTKTDPTNQPTDGISSKSDESNDVSKRISEQFRRFFLSYAQAINKQQGRTGSLFQKNFKRIPGYSSDHLIYLVYYIHANPQRHKILSDFRKYPHSSYKFFLTTKETKLCRSEALEWFGSLDQFLTFHKDLQKSLSAISYLIIED
jgi:putative transposase